jgi:hypothetical protein
MFKIALLSRYSIVRALDLRADLNLARGSSQSLQSCSECFGSAEFRVDTASLGLADFTTANWDLLWIKYRENGMSI